MEKIKKIGIIIIILALFIPLLQYHTHQVFVKNLEGEYQLSQQPDFSLTSWFTGDFQANYDNYYNDHFGFRSSFVRLHNQLQYILFHKVSAQRVVIGKNDYLYEQDYIDSYLGRDFIGSNKIRTKINRLTEIKEDLEKQNTKLLIVIAPGKGYFYPEYIPDSILQKRDTSNYEIYSQYLNETNIPFIDFNSLFMNVKDTSKVVLFPKTGIHWSQGSIPLVADSIIKKIESLLNKEMVEIKVDNVEHSYIADHQDSDIEKALNLALPIPIPLMTYPEVSFINNNAFKPKAITISDSFFWQLFHFGLHKSVFSYGEFWFYNKQIFIDTILMSDEVRYINPTERIQQSDIVILMATESNLDQFPFGFNQEYGQKVANNAEIDKKIKNLMKYIRSNEKWFEKIKNKAIDQGISVDSMLYLDARYSIISE